jgi:hypothetical protein
MDSRTNGRDGYAGPIGSPSAHKAANDDFGRVTSAPSTQGSARGLKELVRHAYINIGKHRVLALAAGVTFYSILAIFPAIADSVNDPEIRAQAARIITAGLGHTGMAPDDRTYLIRQVAARTGLPPPEAEARVNQAIAQSSDAIAKARHGAVILAFMIAASLMLGAAVAWLAAAFGGQHRDGAVAHPFWRRWEVDRMFLIR